MSGATLLTGMLAMAGTAAGDDAAVRSQPSTPNALRKLAAFAGCVAERRPAEADAVLALDYRVPAYRQRLDALAGQAGECQPKGRLRFDHALFAGGLAERLLARHAPTAALQPVAARGPSEAMALCIAKAEPAQARRLFASKPASDQEEDALQALGGALIKCAPGRRTLRLNRPFLRAIVATASYRLARHNNPAAAPAPVN